MIFYSSSMPSALNAEIKNKRSFRQAVERALIFM